MTVKDNENIYHITWVTHNSRISERMIIYKVKKGEELLLSYNDRKIITEILDSIIEDDKFNVIDFIVNADHVHMILICEKEKQSNTVRKLKGKSTQLYKKKKNINDKFNLWAQKYNSSLIKSDKELENVVNYVKYNDMKHED